MVLISSNPDQTMLKTKTCPDSVDSRLYLISMLMPKPNSLTVCCGRSEGPSLGTFLIETRYWWSRLWSVRVRITNSLGLIITSKYLNMRALSSLQWMIGWMLDHAWIRYKAHNHWPGLAEPSNNGHAVIFISKIFLNKSKKSIILSGNAQKQIRPKLIVEITNREYE